MARIFVSYSRKNKDFCKQLVGELQKRDLDFWVDWEGIPPTVDWMNEIEKGIEEADTFLAIISNDWISSKVCLDELNIAVKNGKRLIPVVPYDIVWNDVPPALAQLNFIFFTEKFDFTQQLDKLFTALDTDYDWLKTHRRLQVKALEWERDHKDNGFLLRGRDLEEAEKQISINANKDPCPTDIQREYVLKSRQATDRQRKITNGSLIAATLVMFVITAVVITPRILDKIAQSRAGGEMVLIPEGSTIFGTENSSYVNDFGFPPRQVIASLPAFQIGKYEVTNYQYGQCTTYGNCTVPVDQDDFKDDLKRNYPVVNVTLFQANTYCKWLGQRLPNREEWERAARGPNGDPWPWGNEDPTPQTANMPLEEFTPAGLQPVDSNPAGKSPEGIYNLIGNAWEWTSALAEKTDVSDPTRFWNGEPETYKGTIFYVQRGGGWESNIPDVAVYRTDLGTSAYSELGFRCAANVK